VTGTTADGRRGTSRCAGVIAAAYSELVLDSARRRPPNERRVVHVVAERHPLTDRPVLHQVPYHRRSTTAVATARLTRLPADQHLTSRQPASCHVDGHRRSIHRLHCPTISSVYTTTTPATQSTTNSHHLK